MNINIQSFLLNEEATLFDALKVIDSNAQGICFIVDEQGKLTGILTDGDIRRALLKSNTVDTPVKLVMNMNFNALPLGTPAELINSALNDKIRHIPLIDEAGKLIDFASRSRTRRIPIMQPSLSGNEVKYVTDCVQTGWISSQGSYVKQFEKMFAEYCGVPYALACSNGTTALHLALASLGIGPGDEVIVPDYTFAASINAILYTGATPVLVDIDRTSWTIDIDSVKTAITDKTKAIMPVHIYGHVCDMDALTKLAAINNIQIVEDCAESLGSFYRKQASGVFGAVGAFSFFGNKTITTGEGGMLIFKDKETYERASVLRDHGMSKTKRYWHDHVGYNYRMTNLQAAIGVAQMERIEEILQLKRNIAKTYNKAFSHFEGLQLHGEKSETINSYWLYTMIVNPGFGVTRNEMIERLSKNGIEGRPAFYPLHEMPVYAKEEFIRGREFPNSKYVSENALSLPSYVDLTDEEMSSVIKSVEMAFAVKAINIELT
ncbi:perosamine synthetase [Pseudobacter ginsenosidimutans]|uniref:GDP-perosamine synthase n=3 Tax=Pseudobacter ginsenosidimutans TaxID=661488 RepID=A0A4Q7MYA9_9BACT|nr:perosamine synthetase [Pseudobacter ginsenosidimutans]